VETHSGFKLCKQFSIFKLLKSLKTGDRPKAPPYKWNGYFPNIIPMNNKWDPYRFYTHQNTGLVIMDSVWAW